MSDKDNDQEHAPVPSASGTGRPYDVSQIVRDFETRRYEALQVYEGYLQDPVAFLRQGGLPKLMRAALRVDSVAMEFDAMRHLVSEALHGPSPTKSKLADATLKRHEVAFRNLGQVIRRECRGQLGLDVPGDPYTSVDGYDEMPTSRRGNMNALRNALRYREERFQVTLDKITRDAGTHFSELQRRIWKALEGRALSLDELATELEFNYPNKLYRKKEGDGLAWLKDWQLVKNDRKIGGYYRPDSPPPLP